MLIAFDTETYLIRPGLAAPRMVCLQWDEGAGPQVVLADEGVALFWNWIQSGGVTLVGHHVFYDLAVLCAMDENLIRPVWNAADVGRVKCTKIREMMIANARGELKFEWDPELGEMKKPRFTLERLSWRYLGKTMQKGEDSWRLRYAELDGVPVDRWPEDARRYAEQDAEDTRGVYLAQVEICPEIPRETDQVQAAWALALMRCWGVRTNPAAVAALRLVYEEKRDEAFARAVAAGLVRSSGSRDMTAIKERVVAWYESRGLAVPLSESGKNISTDRDTITAARFKDQEPDPGLMAVADLVRWEKVLSTNVPVLEHGARYPVTPEYNPIIETYRTSCSRPNLQNQGRKGGIRDTFEARPGWVYSFCDYDTLEMRTLAQTCLDLGFESELAKALREGQDPHVELAAEIQDLDPEVARALHAANDAVFGEVRQFAKIPNYGCGGGMGPDALVEYARSFGIEITREKAVELIKAYKRRWSEMPKYFKHCSDLCEEGEDGLATVYFSSGLVRGKVRYTAVCNGFFQHLAAMGAKAALAQVSRECYAEPDSPLYGCRPWLFAHDEIGMEIPYRWMGPRRASAAALRKQEIMVERMKVWCPDVPIGATVAMCRTWKKGAKPVFVGDILVPGRAEGKKWLPDL
jgi:DNA polymerase I